VSIGLVWEIMHGRFLDDTDAHGVADISVTVDCVSR